MKSFGKAGIILLLSLAGCHNGKNKRPVEQSQEISDIKPGKILLKELDGTPVLLEQLKGKTIFINFWATWCKPCLEEMPSIQKAMETLKGENIVYLFASEETREEIEQFKNIHDYPFNYVRAENLAELNIMALPTTFIFNPEGKLVFSEMGYREWDDKENIDLILKFTKSK